MRRWFVAEKAGNVPTVITTDPEDGYESLMDALEAVQYDGYPVKAFYIVEMEYCEGAKRLVATHAFDVRSAMDLN